MSPQTKPENVLKLIGDELGELNTVCSLMAAEVRGANERATKAERERDLAMTVAESILRHRQLEVAAIHELLTELKYHGMTERTAVLVRNVAMAMQGS